MTDAEYTPLVASQTEGGGTTFSAECPVCGARVSFQMHGSWGGSTVGSKVCYDCNAHLQPAMVVTNTDD